MLAPTRYVRTGTQTHGRRARSHGPFLAQMVDFDPMVESECHKQQKYRQVPLDSGPLCRIVAGGGPRGAADLQIFKLASQLRTVEFSEAMLRVATVESLLYDWLMLMLESHVHSQRYFGIYPSTLGDRNSDAVADGSANDDLESFRVVPISAWSAAHVADFLTDLGLGSAAAAAEGAQVRNPRMAYRPPAKGGTGIIIMPATGYLVCWARLRLSIVPMRGCSAYWQRRPIDGLA